MADPNPGHERLLALYQDLSERVEAVERGMPAWHQRTEFIREAAIRLRAAGMGQGEHFTTRGERTIAGPRICWEVARELWDAKPEDC